MPDDDDGWGGTTDHNWNGPGALLPSVPYAAGPPAGPAQAPPGVAPRPPAKTGGRRNAMIAVGAVVVIAAGVVLAVVLNSSHGSGSRAATSSPLTQSNAPTPTPTGSSSTPAGGGTLLKAVPFGSDCNAAPVSNYFTSAVVEQVVCTGSQVTSSVSAAGVGYAKFANVAGLNAWYGTTILKNNGIASNAGNCQTGTTVTTTRGAEYCESAVSGSAGARQLVVRAPATIMLTNGPNSSSADCPNSDYTLLVFTAPADNVGGLALTCSASATVANAFESSLARGAFNLTSH